MLVKESVSTERESKCCRGPNKKKREGFRRKMELKWEGKTERAEEGSVVRKMWDRWAFKSVRVSSQSSRGPHTSMLLTVPLSASQLALCDAITHLFGPEAFVSLGTAMKAPIACKGGITWAFTGPGGTALLWELFTTQVSESHTPNSPPFFRCFSCFPVSTSDSQLTTVVLQFSQLPRLMCHHPLCYCYVVLFPKLPGKWMEQVSVG